MTADKDALRKRLRVYALNASPQIAKDINAAADVLAEKDDGGWIKCSEDEYLGSVKRVYSSETIYQAGNGGYFKFPLPPLPKGDK